MIAPNSWKSCQDRSRSIEHGWADGGGAVVRQRRLVDGGSARGFPAAGESSRGLRGMDSPVVPPSGHRVFASPNLVGFLAACYETEPALTRRWVVPDRSVPESTGLTTSP
jgi:hypothetical protein